MNLRSLDLNLLVVFDAVMEARNTRRAGEKIGLSQPAVSNALSRLRGHLKDDLFVRGVGGLRPTERALELSGPIKQALNELEAAFDATPFSPDSAHRSFAIGTNDYVVTVFLPVLMARLEAQAPGIDLRIRPSAGRSFEMLDAQEIDLAIAAFDPIPERFDSRLLLDEPYVCMMRAGHPLAAGDDLSLDAYTGARHLLVTPRGDETGFIDTQLARLGRTRRIALTINNFSSVPPILSATDLIATLPRAIACTFRDQWDLKPMPLPLERFDGFGHPTMIWHRRLGRHPAHDWLRKVICETAAEVERLE